MTDKEVPLIEKLGLTAGMDVSLLHPPEHYWTLLEGDPAAMGVVLIATEGDRKADVTHLFAGDSETLREAFGTARRGMRENGMVWASWPKQSSGVRSRIVRRFPIIVTLVALSFSACRAEPGASDSTDKALTITSSGSSHPDFSQAVPGDSILGLRLEEIDARPDPVDSFGYTGTARFSGEVSLTGDYRPHFDNPEMRELCFYPDSSSADRLPRFPNDVRTSWFCFTNQEEAQRLLGAPPASGEATIVIDELFYIYQHTDVYNRARLARVIGPAPSG